MAEKPPLLVIAMAGLGDSIFQRHFVRELSKRYDVYLANPWPQLYADLPIKFVRHPLRLRTQEKNVQSLPPETWSQLPNRIRRQYLGYRFRDCSENIVSGLETYVPLSGPLVFDLPPMGKSPVKSRKPIAVIRPVCEREEWLNSARNPDPKYIAYAARVLRERGFHVVSVADLERGKERIVGPEPQADQRFHGGELDVRQLMALVRSAAVVVGGVGWIVPASIALKTPVFIVAGGQGFYNRPCRVTDSRMDLSRVYWFMPDPFCECKDMQHRCNKAIPNFAEAFESALSKITKRQAVAA